jgi:arylsulfatase A-like enzyme
MKKPRVRKIVPIFVVITGVLIGGWLVWLKLDDPRQVSTPVIIYLVDTLRADRLGAYGYEESTSPAIDAIVNESVLFEQAYAPAPWTVPSVASLNTSSFLCEHGLLSERHRLDPNKETLPQRLTRLGYVALGRSQNPFIGPISGLDKGFKKFEERGKQDEPMSAMGKRVENLLNRAWGGEPLYLYIHTMEPHDPFSIPRRYQQIFGHIGIDKVVAYRQAYMAYRRASFEDWARRQPPGTVDKSEDQRVHALKLELLRAEIAQLYDASVRFADSNFADVVMRLKKMGLWNKAIFIFLSDHGEEFGEHGGWSHGQSAYEELIRVPLFIHFPDDAYAGRRISVPVSLLDIMPTIFDYIGQTSICSDCRGESLLPLLAESKSRSLVDPKVLSVREDSQLFHKQWSNTRGNRNVVMRFGDQKLIWNIDSDLLESYDLAIDPAEMQNLAHKDRESIGNLRDEIEVWWKDCNSSGYRMLSPEDMNQTEIDKLRALGYL